MLRPHPRPPLVEGAVMRSMTGGEEDFLHPAQTGEATPCAAESLPLPGGAVTAKPGLRGDTATLKKESLRTSPQAGVAIP